MTPRRGWWRANEKARCSAGLRMPARAKGQAPWHFLNFFSLPQGQGIVAAYGLERIAHRLVAVVAVRTMDMTMAMIVMMIVVVVAVRAVYVGFLTHGGPILG